jgi:hypothetical protein
MTGPSTEHSLSFPETLARLAASADHYYLKSPSIVDRIEHRGRTFYSKFRRVEGAVNEILLRQHLDREITLALPLLREGEGDRLVIEYEGDEPERFVQTLRHLFAHLGHEKYAIYRGKRPDRRTAILFLEERTLDALHEKGAALSGMLQTRLPKSWRILPDRRLPEAYNIYTLPYGYIN